MCWRSAATISGAKALCTKPPILRKCEYGFLLPAITLNASPTDYRPIEQFIMHRFDGNQWEMFGDVMQVSAVN
jgi:hypothetical protein